MISDKDKAIIVNLAQKYEVKSVLLFGSSSEADKRAEDIDIGVEGIAPENFLRFMVIYCWVCQCLWMLLT